MSTKSRLQELIEHRLGDDIRVLVRDAYRRTGTLSGTAAALGVSRPTLDKWLDEWGLEPATELVAREDRQPAEAGAL